MLESSLLGGPLPRLLLWSGCLALAGLLALRGRRWWTRRVPLGVGSGLLAAAAFKTVFDVLWRPFPDPLPGKALVWTGLAVAAFALAGLRTRPARRRYRIVAVVPYAAAALVLVTGLAQVNQHFRAYPTVRSALQLPFPEEVDPSRLTTPAARVVSAPPGGVLADVWQRPADLPAGGAVAEMAVPGPVSGFEARDAWVYVPPAYLTETRAQLPVLVLLAGQPGSPRDWLDGGQLIHTVDAYAAAHDGLAPVVVVADPLGRALGQTLCVDSDRGRAFTYLTVDLPAWIHSTLQVDPDPAHWSIGGLSFGGTCSLQLAVNAPDVYPTFLDLAGQHAPAAGSRELTLDFFGGDEAAFRRVNPLDVLAAGSAPVDRIAGVVVAGREDDRYRPDAQRVHRALVEASVDAEYVELPGGHTFQVWTEGLRSALPFLSARGGLVPAAPDHLTPASASSTPEEDPSR